MICYLDTSALVKLYVQEQGSEMVHKLVDEASVVATSGIAVYILTLPAVGALSLMGEWLLHFLARLRPVRHRPAAHPGTIDLPGLYQQHFHDGQPGQKAGLPYPRAVRLSGGHISHSGIQAAGQNLYTLLVFDFTPGPPAPAG